MRKKQRFGCWVCIAVGSVVGAFALAQERDPFTKKVSETRADEVATRGADMIVLGVELIQVPHETLLAWESEGLNPNLWRKKAQALVDSGEAQCIDSSVNLSRSGQRAKIESSLDLYYPIKEEVIEVDSSGPLFPSVFNTKSLGLVVESDMVLDSEGKSARVSIAFEWSEYAGEDLEARSANDRRRKTDVVTPIFKADKISTQFDVGVGDYFLLTQFSGREAGKSILVFLRYDVVSVPPLKDLTKLNGVSTLRFRTHTVDVPADVWHEMLSENDLPSLTDGGAWTAVAAMLDAGEDAALLFSPVLTTKSGARAKVEETRRIQFDSEFAPPAVLGGNATPENREVAEVGMTWEIDPVLGNNGIADLNFAFKVASLHGYSVSYRKQEGAEWVPTVQFPKIFRNQTTTQAVLHESMHLLAGVMTPTLEDGSLDHSRKRLFFIHNETFSEE